MASVGVAADLGIELEKRPTASLKAAGYEVPDSGPREFISGDYFTDYVVPMEQALIDGEVSRRLAIRRSGVGACVAAHKVSGVRCGTDHRSIFGPSRGSEGHA
jgi:ribose 5-phosphate isomerase B